MVGKAERPADHRQFPLEAAPRRESAGRIVGQMAYFATSADRSGRAAQAKPGSTGSAGSLNIVKVTVCGRHGRGIRHG
jgi:hypothetical protein